MMSIKHLAQCLQHSTCSINVNYSYCWVVGRMDEELHQRLKRGTGKDCGFGSVQLSSIIFIFALLESKLMDESLSQFF